jgi:glycosyltransferase involved in cell wall biosynthesis
MPPAPILLMSRQLSYGGTEKQIAEVAKGLDRDRFEAHVGCFVSGGMRADELIAAGIPIVPFDVRSFKSPSALSAARHMGRYIHQNNIRIVHTFDVPTDVFGVFTAAAYRTPFIISSQRAQRRLSDLRTRVLLRLTDKLSDRVVVNCDAVRRELIEQSKVPAERIRLVYNGLDTNVFNPGTRSRMPQLQNAVMVIGVLCALRKEKGLNLLLQAFARLAPEFPQTTLAIIGSGPIETELKALARDLGIMNRCLFEPATIYVAEWLRSVDIFVLPSLAEALSNSIMEAMACGCSVIASNVGGNPELVLDGRTGLVFESGDVDQLTSRIRLLIENEELRNRLSAASARFMREEFSNAVSLRNMQAVYDELLQPASAAACPCPQ